MKKAIISKNKKTTGYTVLFYVDDNMHYNDIYNTLEEAEKDCKGYKIIIDK